MLGGFVLDTTSLSPAVWIRCGLSAEDVLLDVHSRVPDHLPVVIDLALRRAGAEGKAFN